MKLFRSFRYAWEGIRYCFITQQNFRLHIVFAVVALVAGWLLHIRNMEWIAVSLCIGSVLLLEMINTAIEKICDILHPGYSPGIKIIKDVSAGAVLLAAITSVAAGAIIFIPRILFLLNL